MCRVAETEMFAVKLQRLLDTHRNAEGSKLTPAQVASDVSQRGHKVSKSYLYDLLSGKKDEPSHNLVQALAEYFDVSLDYFADSERGRELARQYEILASLGESNVQQIVHRAKKLSPDGLKAVLDYIDFQANRDDAPRDK